jgi:hypothetical protein
MYHFKSFRAVAILCLVTRGFSSATERGKYRRDSKPQYSYDPNTTKYCSWWIDNDGSVACSSLPDAWFISMADFLRWVSLNSWIMLLTLLIKVLHRIPQLEVIARILRLIIPTALKRQLSLRVVNRPPQLHPLQLPKRQMQPQQVQILATESPLQLQFKMGLPATATNFT